MVINVKKENIPPPADAPPAKRQKMSSYGSSHTALKQQDSFTEVLAQLEADAESTEYAQGGGVEGEADGERKIGHIETSAAWPRPALGKWNAQTDKIVFQQIDIDESTDATTGSTLRLFGLTKKGNSVLVHVHGFKPYFYVAAPKDFMTEDCKHLKDQLNASVTAGNQAAVVNVSTCMRKSLWGYRGNQNVPFIKITCVDQRSIPRVKDEY